MNRQQTLNLGELICLIAAICVISYFLRQDKLISISSVVSSISRWPHHFHLIGIGLIPVYIALMIFGTASIGIYLGSTLQRWITDWFYHK